MDEIVSLNDQEEDDDDNPACPLCGRWLTLEDDLFSPYFGWLFCKSCGLAFDRDHFEELKSYILCVF